MNSSLALDTLPQNSASEPDSTTIQRQRKELQLLIAELKDRDKELNEMVTVHQRQLLAWEDDRQKFLTLAERCSRLENELHKRNEMITTLTRRLKLLESQQNDRKMTLENTQQKLQELSRKASDTTLHCQALEDKNQALNSLVMELSSKVGQLQAREQELLTVLKLKDNDILEASNHISEFMGKFKKLENALRAARMEEANINKEKQDFIFRVKELTLETNRLKSDLSEKTKESNEKREEIIRLKQENGYLNNELLLSAERANRKDQLLQSAKSKQRRTDTELSNLRQIYVKQQRDLQFLHFSMESSQEVKQKPKTEVQETRGQAVTEEMDAASGDSGLYDHDVSLKFLDLDAPCLTSTQKTSETDGHDKFVNTEFPLQLMNVTDVQAANVCGHPTIFHDSCSPSSKLQRLLAESQQMVADLELTNLLGASPFCSPKSSQPEVTEYTESLRKVRLPEEKSKTKLSLHSL